ncbi:MAG: Fur family transcriptional regulator [Turicibacter sp.]
MKYSKQREMILNFIKDNPVHPTADLIYETLKKDNPNLSLGTVYRNLAQLADHNLIQKVSMAGHPDRYDGTLSDHYHFLCIECGKVTDLFIEGLNNVNSMVESECGVKVLSTEMSFKGICNECIK